MNVTLLHKYLSGENSAHEKQIVENWLNADSRNQKYLDTLKQIWDVSPGKKINVDTKAAWESVRHRNLEKPELNRNNTPVTDIRKPSSGYHKNPIRQKRGHSHVWAYISAAAAVIVIAFLFTQHISLDRVGPKPQQVMKEVVTERGQRTTLRLFDGTSVYLNVDSQIRINIPSNFDNTARHVYLEGEAYFEVVSNPDKPFLVHTSDGITKVLGTKFNVRAYPDEDEVQVVVAEGKVLLGPDEHWEDQNIQLTQNRRGILSKSGEVAASTVLNLDEYIGWKSGKLSFHGASLAEVKHRLERWYDIDITLQNEFSSLSKRLTASFEDEPLTEILNVVVLALDVKYKREGRKVTIFRDK